MSAPQLPYLGLLPIFILLGGAALVMLADALWKRAGNAAGWIAALAVLASGAALAVHPALENDGTGTLWPGSSLYGFFGALVLLGALGAVLMAIPYFRRGGFLRGEFFALLLLSATGGLLLAAARDLLFLFVALEILTVPLFVLAGFYRREESGIESALKYFLVGIFSSAFLLYGIALFYGATGTLDLLTAGEALRADPALAGAWLVRLSLGLMVVGIGFKIAAVPFHFWAPDVYQGAPTPVTVYLAVASKAGGFVFAWKVLLVGFGGVEEVWTGLLTWIAVATLLLGALLAMLQEDLKRLLAYSSIAHAGFALIALVAAGRMGGGHGVLVLYLLIYAISALGAFAAVTWVERAYGGPLRIGQYAGLAGRHPFLAAGLGLCMLSLAGIPPAAGFVGKFVVVWAAILAQCWLLAVVAMLTAVVGLYYYIRVVVAMYFRPWGADTAEPGRPGAVLAVVLALACAAILVLGIYPGPVLELLGIG